MSVKVTKCIDDDACSDAAVLHLGPWSSQTQKIWFIIIAILGGLSAAGAVLACVKALMGPKKEPLLAGAAFLTALWFVALICYLADVQPMQAPEKKK
jgi:hypothetical protein